MNLLLDTGLLGQLCHPAKQIFQPVLDWVEAILVSGADDRIFLPELCDYELRRKLLHIARKGQSSDRSVRRLNELCDYLEYLPLDTSTMRKAADFWCESRLRGQTTAPEHALDGDSLLAAQAAMVGGTVVTTNRKHLSQFVPAWDRTEIVWGYPFVCIRGPVDNLAFDWKDHFMVRDSQGRNWHCRQEATWNSQQEVSQNRLLAKLDIVAKEIVDLYQKLFSSGHGTTEGTVVRTPITICSIPISQSHLLAKLSKELGQDSNDAPDNND